MKIVTPFVLWISLLMIASCTAKQSDKPLVFVTIQPQAYFAHRIAGDVVDIEVMVPSGSSPESYDPTPDKLARLHGSHAYMMIGHLGYELAWADRLIKNNPNTVFFDNSDGIDLIGGHVCSNTEHQHGAVDPHYWSSPHAAIKLAGNICEALTKICPDKEQLFNDNYHVLLQEMEAMNAVWSKKLADASVRSFVIYHPALGYIARDYNLEQLAIEHDGKEPTPRQLKDLIDTARAKGVKTLFIQKEFDTKNIRIVGESLGVEPLVINPLAYDWEKEMNRILEALTK